ncbi:MAG: hypothetical protein IJ567_07650 [Lachnospiraceae bacterium]|nr:hypothetical protein [Lachnospiraceae bacterium]
MKRLCGYTLFMIGIGILVMLILPNDVLGVIISIVLLIVGYNLFCSKCK